MPEGERYVGATWRSRFLRAPKFAFEIECADGFIRLSDIGTVRLGLKTGADEFFFVKVIDEAEFTQVTAHSKLPVSGLKGSWRGAIRKRDLKPVALNPHTLIRSGARIFTVPRAPEYYYLYPSGQSTDAGLSDYVTAAERLGINARKLVRQNASSARWFVQDRAVIDSLWALPYNSGYDYGAWDNSHRAVLNGRFVGVEPLDGVDSDLFGVALNSTFVGLARLLEGTSTGSEGAFDVGPPAARRMVVPDVRKFSESSIGEIKAVLEELRDRNVIPSMPTRTGMVDPLRRRLDTAVLVALGRSNGEAAIMIDQAYASYGRWRAGIEDLEAQVRQNRKVMAREGLSRTTTPAESIGARVWNDIAGEIPTVPFQLVDKDTSFQLVDVPSNLRIDVEQPSMRPGEVQLKNGVLDLGSFERVRYLAMLLRI